MGGGGWRGGVGTFPSRRHVGYLWLLWVRWADGWGMGGKRTTKGEEEWSEKAERRETERTKPHAAEPLAARAALAQVAET